MSKSITGNNLRNGSAQERQSLTRIKGIGLAKQRWLREVLKIDTIRDLACFSVEQIESRLQAQEQTFSHSEIKKWIEQAQQLAASELSAQEILESPKLLINERKSSQSGTKSTNTEENGQWRSFASFKVEFQSRKSEGELEEQRIKVDYLEAGNAQIWDGIKPEEIPQWMLEQMKEEILPEAETKAQKAPSETPLVLEITQIRAFQPPRTERAMVVDLNDRLFQRTISAGEPFVLEITLEVDGCQETNLSQSEVTYQAQFYARNRCTGVISHLGSTKLEMLDAKQDSYKTRLPETTLEPGIYRLQGVVQVQGAIATPGCFEIPLLQVI